MPIKPYDLCKLILIAVLLASCITPPASRSATRSTASRGYVYLPVAGGSPLPTPDPVTSCLGDAGAAAFYRLLTTDPRQQRAGLTCHPALVRAAQRRAASLIASGLWSHCDPAGVCANTVARNMGCALPADYGNGNNIESLVAGSPDPGAMFAALAASPGHADHLFGRGWFRHQRHIGIAVMPGGRYGWYWVVMIGVCLETSGEGASVVE